MSRGEVSVPPRLAAVAGPSTGATGWSSAAHGSSMTHEEVEFCAEEELVTIVPAFRKDAPLALLSGKYGPFIPQVPIQVPLWMAVALATRAKCVIQPPQWMDPPALEEVLRKERESEAEFQPLPFHYIEISVALFKYAGDAFGERRQRVYDLVDNIRSVRFNKIERGLRRLEGATAAYIRLNNVSAMEVNLVRPFIVTALNRFAHTAAMEDQAERSALAAAANAGRRAAGGAAGAAGDARPRRQLRR